MTERYQYLALMGLCLLGTLFLEFRFDARIWRRPRELALALLVPFGVFNFVNEVAVWRHLWFYSRLYTTGIELPRRYPIEEVVFFIAIPICALLTFEAACAVYDGRVKSVLGKQIERVDPAVLPPVGVAEPKISFQALLSGLLLAGCALLLVTELWLHRFEFTTLRAAGKDVLNATDWNIREYPILAVGLLAGVFFLERVWWRTGVFSMRAYWSTMAINLFFMVLVNGWLTKLSAPIVTYAEDEFSGLRPIWDIPLEDFGFGIALLTLVIMSWLRVTRRSVNSSVSVCEVGRL